MEENTPAALHKKSGSPASGTAALRKSKPSLPVEAALLTAPSRHVVTTALTLLIGSVLSLAALLPGFVLTTALVLLVVAVLALAALLLAGLVLTALLLLAVLAALLVLLLVAWVLLFVRHRTFSNHFQGLDSEHAPPRNINASAGRRFPCRMIK